MTFRRGVVLITLAMLLHGVAAAAWADNYPSISFNGFGTLGLVHSNEDQADFVSNSLVDKGAGYSSAWSADVDSRLGLQLTADLTSRLSGIVQVVAERRYDGTYTPALEWANIKFDVTPDFDVRIGRVVLPVFMTSEYRKVGYANPWVRPPQEVYHLVPVTNIDGVEASYRYHFQGFTNTLRGTFGNQDNNIAGGGVSKARDGVTVVDSLEWEDWTVFARYSAFRLTIDNLTPLFDGFRQFGAAGQAIADRYDVKRKAVHLMSFGARYDPGTWFVMGEWARLDSRSFIGKSHGWYVTAGRRFGAVTPYATLAGVALDSASSTPGLSAAGLPSPLAATARGLDTGLNQLLAMQATQTSLSLGTRWDFARNMDLKAQFDYLDLGAGSAGVLTNVQPGFRPGGSVSLFSIALDFVF
ncbi:MAG: hypothetical protein WB783_18885 [Arenicellales bacterium]